MRNPSRSRSTVLKTVAATLLATAAFEGVSYAQLLKIGVSFLGRNEDGILAMDDSAGVIPQQDWNNMAGADNTTGNTHNGNQFRFNNSGNGPFTSLPLFTDNGAAGSLGTSAVTFSVGASDSWNSDGPNTTPDEKLMQGFIKINQGFGLGALTVNNLPGGFLYNVIVYTSMDGTGANGDFQLTGATAYDKFFVTVENSFDGTFTQGTSTNAAARTAETDYMRWDNVTPNGTGQLIMNWTHAGGNNGVGPAGFQIIQIAPPTGPDRFWNGVSGAWNTTTMNWRTANTDGVSDAIFATNDKANFGNLGVAGPRTVTVDAAGVTTSEFNVNNTSANNYTIAGGPILGVAAPLTKDGNGTLTLTGANEFGGSTTIKHGTVNVTTIGDGATAGNLGKGSGITIGDTVGTNDAKLSYAGVTATVGRGVTIGSNGGELEITDLNSTVTFTNPLNGSGTITKSGPGSVVFSSTGGNFSGGITVPSGKFTVRTLGVGTGAINLSGASTFTYQGVPLNDTRSLTVGAGGATIALQTNAATRLRIGAATATAGNLTLSGPGRLDINGVANFTALPTLSANATLALTNELGTNILPATFSVPTGRLELAPGSFAAATPMNLSGGILRLGHEGLQGFYYTTPYDTGAWQNSLGGTYRGVGGAFTALGAPLLQARTNSGGQTNLDFGNNNGSADVPFANQGLTAANTDPDGDNIRVAFTGKILITTAGDTQFFTTSDDGSLIFIDGQRVVNNNAYQGMTERTGTINLSAGLHDILVTFHEGGGGAGLIAQYQPAGGTKQPIPNSVLFAGDTFNSTATPVNVTASSTIEIGSSLANLGALTQSAATTLKITGSASFAGTTLGGAGDHAIETTSPLGSVNLGPITGAAGNTITKTGNGALVFSAPAPVGGLVVNSNAGVVVVQATKIGAAAQTDPLAGVTVNLNGGGLGFSVAPGSTEASTLTYTNNAVSTNDYKISAGNYYDNPFLAINQATINWNPANNAVNVASTKTATFEVTSPGFVFNVGAPVTGAGALSLDQGTVNFTSATGVTAPGGLTVRAATSNITGPITTGALNMSGSFAGVNGGDLNTPNIGSLHALSTVSASSVNMNGNSLIVDGVLTNTGTFTQTRGTTTLAASTHASVSLSGGTLNANGNLTSAGALTITGGLANLNAGTHSVPSVTVNGTGDLTLRGTLASAGVTSVSNGRTFAVDPGASNTATYTGGTVNLSGNARVSVNSGIADYSAVAINATPVTITITPNALNGRLFILGPEGSAPRLDPQNQAEANLVFGGGAPGTSLLLTNALSFANDGEFANFFGAGNPGAQNFTAAFAGRYTPSVSGTTTFNALINDDQVGIWLDLNQNGVFEAAGSLGNERISNGNCCGPSPIGNANNLVAGQIYNVLFAVQDTGGGSSLRAQFNTSIVDPSAQPGLWSSYATNGQGGNLSVAANSELRVKSFTGITDVALSGGIDAATAARVLLPNNAAATVSDANTIALSGTTPQGLVTLGNNNTVNVGRITVPDNGVLVLDKTAGAGAGGVLALNGTVQGIVGTAPSTIGAGSVSVVGSTLLVNAPITGTGTVSASIAGTIGGNSTISGPVSFLSGGTGAPGGATPGTEIANLGTGNLSFAAGAVLKLDISSSLSYDSLTVTGTVGLTGNPTLQLSLLNFTGAVGNVYYIVNNDLADAVTGLFNGVADQGSINGPNGSIFQISYDANFGTAFDNGGNDIALKLTQVPEPGSLVALMSGVGMLLGMQRLRRRSI